MDQSKLEALVDDYLEAQRKMSRERQRLQQLAAGTATQLKEAKAAGLALEERFFTVYAKLIQVLLGQIERFKVDATPSLLGAGAMLGIKWSSIETQLMLLHLDQLNLAALFALIESDFEAAIAGQPPQGAYPAAWLAVRPQLASSPDWQQAVRAFSLDYPDFAQAVEQAVTQFDRIASTPLQPAHLKEAKALELPTLRGQHYRLETHFRKLPEGQALLDGTRIRPVEIGSTVPQAQESPGKKLTGMLKGLFK